MITEYETMRSLFEKVEQEAELDALRYQTRLEKMRVMNTLSLACEYLKQADDVEKIQEVLDTFRAFTVSVRRTMR